MKRICLWAVPLLAVTAAGAVGTLLFLQSEGITPRALAPYLLKRTSGHNPLIEASGVASAATLLALDRGTPLPTPLPALTLGAQPGGAPAAAGTVHLVASADEARRAFANALPGDVITFVPGTYPIRGNVEIQRPGLATAPIVVRAALPGSVTLALDATEGFVVAAPYWRFENLTLRGVCGGDGCQHAFHVVGAGHHFVARHNTINDFNAHFKINGLRGVFPDHGLIEANTLGNRAPRQTASPVTPIDLVAASDWTIRANLIHDFIKTDGDRISYGAYAKGGAERTLFERNVVLCEPSFSARPGQRVGLSFGGGETDRPYCRDGRCITEHDAGTMRANLIVGCSDAGIYLNSSANSQILDNTLLDTAGVHVRFATSGATLDGNLIDGPVRAYDGGVVRDGDNLSTAIGWLYLGRHPQRALFADPARLDLHWRATAPQRAVGADAGAAGKDLCGVARASMPAYGAFENFSACLRAGS